MIKSKRQNAGGKGKKKQYRTRNWKEYNQALVDRGKVVFHVTEEALKQWKESKKTGTRGKPRLYSDTAIETALILQQTLRLPLRQTEGLLSVILGKFKDGLTSPDYSTLCLRKRTLSVTIRVMPLSEEPVHLVVDSTGAKVFGEGEWKVRKHGWSKHRTWKKLHIGVNEKTHEILIGEVTGNDVADGETLPILITQLPENMAIGQFSGDGAYDTRGCYEVLAAKGIPRITIPPRKGARIWRHANTKAERLPRDESVRRIRDVGKKQWKEESGYHRRSLSETAMFRIKSAFGDKVAARTPENQRTELLLRCRIMNMFTLLGMPQSYVAA
jgi:IS5 family transposase